MEQIAKAIQSVMTEINGVEKSMTVWSGQNSYKGVSDKDVKQLLRDAMIKNWLSILPTDVQSKIQVDRWEEVDQYSKSVPKDMKSKQSIFTEVTTKYILLHTSWESITLAGYWQGVDTQDKWAGKATTYALKNTLLNMFLIPTGVDTDNTHSDEYDVPKKVETKQTYTAEKKWFNFPDLKLAIKEWFDTDIALRQYIKDFGFTCSAPMWEVIKKYLTTGELEKPEFKK